jgi:Fe-S oxidoreductase
MLIEIENVKQTTELCRYCLMCRHTCPVTHVTRSEATSPHGWGMLIASVSRGVTTWHEETVDVLYQCADCGLCQAHCVTDQPLPLAINAARAEVVAQQAAPEIVYQIQQKLQQWANPYMAAAPTIVTGQGDAALLVGAVGHHFEAEAVTAASKLLVAAGAKVVPIAQGRESAYLANSLGLPAEARQLAQASLAEIEQVGARQVFVLSPGEVYTSGPVFKQLGLTWPEGVEMLEVTTFLAERLRVGKLAFGKADLKAYTFFDPDQTVRGPGRWEAPRQLLAALSDSPPIELFWRKERAAPCGVSGGLTLTQPRLAGQLAQARLAEAAERGIETIICDDPAVLHHLRQQATESRLGIEVRGLFELLATHLVTT